MKSNGFNQKIKKIIGLALIVSGLSLVVYSFTPVKKQKYSKSDQELTSLTAYLINPPQYLRSGGKNSREFLRLELDGYVRAYFENDSEFLDATDWRAVLKEIKYHDTVTIKVLKKRFDRFYVNQNSLSSFEKIIYHPTERFNYYSLQFKGKEYIHDIYEAAEKLRKRTLIIRIVVSILLIYLGIYCIRKWK